VSNSTNTRLIDVVFNELDNEALDHLAALLAPRLSQSFVSTTAQSDGWLGTQQAADYLGITRGSLHQLTAARAIPFEQQCAGGKCWFKRSELDAWRRGQA
jgi:excisionase family DNA binding protein